MRKKLCMILFAAALITSAIPVYAGKAAEDEAHAKTVNAIIPVTCEVKGTASDEKFTVNINSNDLFLPTEKSLTLGNGETGNFDIPINYPGTYKYDINQEAGNTKDATYDSTIYKAEVFVTENDNGVLNAETIVYTRDSNNKSTGCKFVNIFPEGYSKGKEDNPKGISGGSSSGNSGGMTATQKGDSTPTERIKTGVETNEFAYACAGLAGMLVAALAVRKRRSNN